ncbi:HAD-IIB family hydrolase [Salipiger mucosus]|uniref:Putative mannosyl-3-phosphoglycerate phosphatase n=1 Tax=Salipiger mucosus DSM 16094 TaxID=1123237 RepID=S9Q8C9_9RHOB|nr:HAD-IIB family hydrolase [Salipiger mucosus]EPX76282.1 Putative mannosyl-3-phosphoglycerate phosphatase [Salipiger mucosus DSM 16094]
MRLIVFTDLDGTLLDHDSYSFAPAQPALDALRARGIPLILATSKTAAEIAPLHAQLGLGDWPAIVENGAQAVVPRAADSDTTEYDRIRAALDALPHELRAPFTGFGDMSLREVALATGLPEPAAELARQRRFSEPGTWTGDESTRAAFLNALAARGISARRGGRFLTLSAGGTKAGCMAGIMRDLDRDTSIALGDAPNDVEMIETADHGVIVRNDAGTSLPQLAGESRGRVRRTTAPGPAGWNRAVLDLLDETAPTRSAD